MKKYSSLPDTIDLRYNDTESTETDASYSSAVTNDDISQNGNISNQLLNHLYEEKTNSTKYCKIETSLKMQLNANFVVTKTIYNITGQ